MVTRNIFQVWVILHFFHTVILSGKVCYSYYLKSRVYKLPSKGNLYYKKIAVIFLSFVKRSYLMLFLFSHLLRKVFVTSAISLEKIGNKVQKYILPVISFVHTFGPMERKISLEMNIREFEYIHSRQDYLSMYQSLLRYSVSSWVIVM